MKIVKNLSALSILISIMTLVACNGVAKLDIITMKGESTIELNAAGAPKQVQLFYTQNWITTVEGDWIEVTPLKGDPKTLNVMDSLFVTIAAKRNTTGGFREGSVTFATQNAFQKIKVKQSAY